MSKKNQATAAPAPHAAAPAGPTVKARVLVDGAFGKVNAVVEVDADTAAASGGQLDTHPDAVAYAESIGVAEASDAGE